MKLIKKLVINIVVAAALLYIFNYYQLGIIITFNNPTSNLLDYIGVFLILGGIFWLFNSPIKGILKILSCPVNFLTLGLLSLAINVLIFYLFQYVANSFFDGELVVTLGNILQTLILSFIMAAGTSILTKIL